MYLIFDEAVVTRSSNFILFFRINKDTGLWEEYHRINKMRGQIYFIRGNVRIQVITDEKIYFFMINKETLMPTLENVMNNFMNCSMMMIGKFVRFAITYKTNQQGFIIYTRSAYHNFKVTLDARSFEGAHGINFSHLDKYAVGKGMEVRLYDQKTFTQIGDTIEVENPDNDPELHICYMVTGTTQKRIGISLGKKILRN